jgi:GTP pyrophosphokinase
MIRSRRSGIRWAGAEPLRDEVTGLEHTHRKHCRGADLRLLREAYRVAARLHNGQTRDSGKPFIIHPVAVARIVAELGLDTTAVAAALLHDTVEDTSYTLGHLRSDFGDAVARLVDGVTKLEKIYFGEAAEAETFRKMILAARADIRVLILKIADRLHNMRTLSFKPRPSQVRTATVTREIIIPLADRLGLYAIRRELEDLVLAALEPETFHQVDDYLHRVGPSRQAQVSAAQRQVAPVLRSSHIRAKVYDRPRHHYSVYREMTKYPQLGPQNPPRLIVVVAGGTVDCYRVLGAVHRTWQPIPGRFTDLIATPKYNLYQSLHTTVVGPAEAPMDVLIRTRHMHTVAELGIAADLADRHRPGDHPPGRDPAGGQFEWLDRLLAWQQQAGEPDRFLDSLRTDLGYRQVTIITAEGSRVTLPAGATCVDLAYQLDPLAAAGLVAAHVNGRLVSLSAALSDGDLVELIHTQHEDHPRPAREWLQSARTPHARLRISRVFAEHGSAAPDQGPAALRDQVHAGRAALGQALRRRDRALPDDDTLAALAVERGFPDPHALFVAAHHGRLDADELADQLVAWVDRHTPTP